MIGNRRSGRTTCNIAQSTNRQISKASDTPSPFTNPPAEEEGVLSSEGPMAADSSSASYKLVVEDNPVVDDETNEDLDASLVAAWTIPYRLFFQRTKNQFWYKLQLQFS